MKLKLLDTVVLARDLPEHGLRSGDVGAVVHVYEPNGIEVEFVAASGDTRAVVSLAGTDVRRATATDILAARPAS